MKGNSQNPTEESLKKTMHEGGEPSVEQLAFTINKQEALIKQLKSQLNQAAEAYRDMQIRLATTEFHHRLEFLWKVMFTENSSYMFGDEFIKKCAGEFKDMMFPVIPDELKPGAPENKEQDA